MALLEYIGFLGCFQFFVTLMCVLYLRYTEPEKHRPIKVQCLLSCTIKSKSSYDKNNSFSGGSKGGPNSFNSCSFWENLAKSYVGAPPTPPLPPPQDWRPHLGEILDPPLPFFAAKLVKEINCTTYT